MYHRTEYLESLDLLNGLPNKDAEVYQVDRAKTGLCWESTRRRPTLSTRPCKWIRPIPRRITGWAEPTDGEPKQGSFLTAPGNASKARQFFEKSVELDPKNLDAVNDLFDYYLEAPGFLGGGVNKAETLATHIGALNPAEGHYAEAQIKDKLKEYSEAEAHLRMAAELSPHQVGRVIDIAKYLAKLHRFVESEIMWDKAAKMAPDQPKVLYNRAETYVKTNRNLDEARKLLQEYMQSRALTPDDPPREEAEALLKKIPN